MLFSVDKCNTILLSLHTASDVIQVLAGRAYGFIIVHHEGSRLLTRLETQSPYSLYPPILFPRDQGSSVYHVIKAFMNRSRLLYFDCAETNFYFPFSSPFSSH